MQAHLEQYKVFKAVADSGNISATAKSLYLSQSAVSQSIKTLESSLGVRLFSRSRRGVTLTNDGRTLYEYVSGALALLEAGENRLNESRELTRGELTIGASNTLTESYLLRYLQEYHRSYPGVRVRILNGTSRRVMNYLHGGTCDLAFVTTDEPVEGFDNHLCLKTHTSFVAAADYPVDFNRAYTLAEISAAPRATAFSRPCSPMIPSQRLSPELILNLASICILTRQKFPKPPTSAILKSSLPRSI